MSKKHLILDLDATLICSHFKDSKSIDEILKNKENGYLKDRVKISHVVDIGDADLKGKGEISSMIVVLRPYVYEFLSFILDYFDYVHIWSAGIKRYVRALEYILFPPGKFSKKIHKVLTRLNCDLYDDKHIKTLDLHGFPLEDTLILDDNELTFKNNLKNAIHIPAYTPQIIPNHINFDDKSLLKVIEWIKNNDIKNCKDVREIDKSKIFK
jgi:TFIIF-interacting CTD phosphatase-like protein